MRINCWTFTGTGLSVTEADIEVERLNSSETEEEPKEHSVAEPEDHPRSQTELTEPPIAVNKMTTLKAEIKMAFPTEWDGS